jgi:hypothetical protein
MDPYLERFWRDVHHRLITYASEQLQEQLPDDLRARIEERVFLETTDAQRTIYPDVYVVERPGDRGSRSTEVSGGRATAEPLLIDMDEEPVTQGYIEIREAGSGNRVISVIEFVSPSNRVPGDGQDLYRQKQQECLAGHISLVEVNLVRRGEWVLSVSPDRVPSDSRTLYQVCVRRAWRPKAEFYPIGLRDPLPAIRVPLRKSDPDAALELQSLIERCYRLGRYDDLRYDLDLDPPLPPADRDWADELLRSAGYRS